ncbi:MAG TPA: phage tail protein [Desulfobacteraceae bacterium]|nr:phage tail protein [Desulfobacteraceae bacterium]|tara:strand:+ start:3033 stop:3257 length:225 start_codon:yes stop_codon:yes gene_type:complete
MSYTQDDLNSVQAAILDLATGKRVTKVSFSNGEVVEYGLASLDGLKTLRATIQSEIDSAAGNKSFFRAVTSKGL